MSQIFSEILKLSVPERILLVEAIWDSIANENNKSYELSSDRVKMLEEELKDYGSKPDEGSSWEAVKKQ